MKKRRGSIYERNRFRFFNSGFEPFFLVFFIITALVIGFFLFMVVGSIRQYSFNNKQPQVTTQARVLTKRTKVSGGSGDSSASTWYYITFETVNGDRKEFQVKGQEYGMLVDGDPGTLSYQGTRYRGFNSGC
ncbi:DUF2500 domain-containing protein [Peribacillus psychrosaccharolyticus]|uniref:DUF2500 domain-containing protein n=1 Tax=Peribacillus psychrosaccharolyticus TaxID=1407 RepID=UPI003D2CAF03